MTSEERAIVEEIDYEELIDYLIAEGVIANYPAILDQFDKFSLINYMMERDFIPDVSEIQPITMIDEMKYEKLVVMYNDYDLQQIEEMEKLYLETYKVFKTL